ncbi:MAG: hypothetical protein OXD54_11575 [Candidatus Poribacteria bacterium]|nr:hypothetical protein [Candidatus Poribacteria bacterium]
MKQFFKDLTVSMFSGLFGKVLIPLLLILFAGYTGYKVVNVNPRPVNSTEIVNSEIVNSADVEKKEVVDNNQFNMARYIAVTLSSLTSMLLAFMCGSGLIFDIFRWIKERRPLKIKELELKIKLAELQQNSINNKDDKDNTD